MKLKSPTPLDSAQDEPVRQWVATNVQRRYVKETVDAAVARSAAGGTPEEIATVATATAVEARARYLATSALVLGALSTLLALATGGLSILTVIFTLLSGERGIKSSTRRTHAIAGMALAGVAVLVFIARLASK